MERPTQVVKMTELQKINAEIDQLECSWEYSQVYGDYDNCAIIRQKIMDLKQRKEEIRNEIAAGN